jgi:hypothetical protein
VLASATRATPSSRAAATEAGSGPGRGINASRCTTTPASAAANTPRSSAPITAAQAPCAVAAASIASSNAIEPCTTTTDPGRSPPGSSSAIGSTTGNGGRPPGTSSRSSSVDAGATGARCSTDVTLATAIRGPPPDGGYALTTAPGSAAGKAA